MYARKQICLLFLLMALSGCAKSLPTDNPSASPTDSGPTPTSVATFSPTRAATEEEVEYFLQTNGDCDFPCFWGIYPEETNRLQVQHFLNKLGKEAYLSPRGTHLYQSAVFAFKENGRISLKMDVQHDIVTDIAVTLDGLWNAEISPRDWSAYNLDEVLKEYGPPSSIDLYLDLPNYLVLYGIRLTYKDRDTSILYGGSKSYQKDSFPTQLDLCPSNEITDVTLKLGKNPIDPEPDGVPLSRATSLDIRDFYELFSTDTPTCFSISLPAMGW